LVDPPGPLTSKEKA
jgi:hypothetical protein